MKAIAKQHTTGEFFPVVQDDKGNILYQAATTCIDRVNALQRAQKWIREKRAADAERAEKTLKRVRRHYKGKKNKQTHSIGDVVTTPKGAGLLQKHSKTTAVVKVSGRLHTFALSEISPL